MSHEPADSNPSLGTSPPSQPGTITPEDLEQLLEEGLASSEPLSLEESSERYESSCLMSTASVPEQDTPKHWKQLEQWVADLQAEVVSLRGHKACCERTTLSLLQELLQVHTCLQLQDSELKRLQQAAQAPEKAAFQVGCVSPRQKQLLCARLVEVWEALTQIRRKQALQDSERKGAEQEASLRLSELTEKLKQEERDREVACGALQKSQEEVSQRVDHEVARMQAQMTKLREEMSLCFLKREAKLCSFLQKSFLALEKRMKASESARLRVESGLWEELESQWQQLRELDAERTRALQGQRQQEECHLLEQCWGLDKAVVQLTKFVRQNQASLSHILLAEQKAWDAKGKLENSRAGELATYLQESLETMQLAGELAQQEMYSALELVRRKEALEVSVAELVRQVKDMSDHFLALSWRLDLQEQTLSLRLCEVSAQSSPGKAHLDGRGPQPAGSAFQIEAIADTCILHKRDSDFKIPAEAKARELEGEAMRQELAALPSSVQLLREGNPGRKIAKIQGKLATFQNQMMKLESSIQYKTIQNLKFNTETKRVRARGALTLGSTRVLMSLVRQQFFIKDVAPDKVVPMNHWGMYQAVRWLRWKAVLMKLAAWRRPRALLSLPLSQK
uniref:Coiled-coil domain containing 154 n=1 Tax=Monodon monoceros TaxID=40151 RepID=A0A8C6API2_MONMO